MNDIEQAISDAVDEHEVEEVEEVEAPSDIQKELNEDSEDQDAREDEDSTEEPRDGKDDVRAEKDVTDEATTDEAPADAESSAPVGLSASAREEWKDTPKAVQKWAKDREKQFSVGIQKYAEGAKQAQIMNQVLQPFGQYLQANGGAPRAISTLLGTAVQLQSGSVSSKATAVASLIKDFSIDIDALDMALSGTDMPAEMQGNDVASQIATAIKPFQDQITQFQTNANNQSNALIDNEVNAFGNDAKHEFYKDVRMDMADLMDMSANRGANMSLDEAYQRACAMNPEISTIVQARKNKGNAARKKQASSSVRGQVNGGVTSLAGDSIRSQLESAVDSIGRV